MADIMLETLSRTSCAIDQSCCGGADATVVEEESCTLNPSEMPERVARWKALFHGVLSYEIESGCAKFHFEDTSHLRNELEELIKLEQVCCAHVSWKLQRWNGQQLLLLSCEEKTLRAFLHAFIPSSITLTNEGLTL